MFGQYSVSHAMFSYEKHLATSLQRLSKTHSIFKHISVSIFEHHSSVQNVQHFGAQKKKTQLILPYEERNPLMRHAAVKQVSVKGRQFYWAAQLLTAAKEQLDSKINE